jgi:hypothetical protein
MICMNSRIIIGKPLQQNILQLNQTRLDLPQYRPSIFFTLSHYNYILHKRGTYLYIINYFNNLIKIR